MKVQLEVESKGWRCGKCGEPLQPVEADISYMGSIFKVDLPGCPACGFTYIPPDLAMGKMLEVEKLLEDK